MKSSFYQECVCFRYISLHSCSEALVSLHRDSFRFIQSARALRSFPKHLGSSEMARASPRGSLRATVTKTNTLEAGVGLKKISETPQVRPGVRPKFRYSRPQAAPRRCPSRFRRAWVFRKATERPRGLNVTKIVAV